MKVRLAAILAVLLIAGMILPACGGIGDSERDFMSSGEPPEPSRDKELDTGTVVYDKPIQNLRQDESIIFDVEFDPLKKGFDVNDLRKIADVYLDSDLTVSANPRVEYSPEKGQIIISPPYVAAFNELYKDLDLDWDFIHWGGAERYFAVRYYSPGGEKLEKPVVTVFTVENSLPSPEIKFYKQNGYAALEWNAVEGAEEYRIYLATKTYSDVDGGYWYYTEEIGRTSENNFLCDNFGLVGAFSDISIMNLSLKTEKDDSYFFCIAAIKGNQRSQVSNAVHSRDIKPVLPYSIALDSEEDDTAVYAGTVSGLGMYRLVEMCDGSKVTMPVTYHIDKTEIIDLSDISKSFDRGSMALYIPYTVSGIALSGYSIVGDYDYPELEQDLQRLKEREVTNPKSGMLEQTIELNGTDEPPPSEGEEDEVSARGYRVFASNALSEYLAVHMLNGSQIIDLNDFNESFDYEYLLNAWCEAIYQNPMVLRVKGFRVLNGGYIFVDYGQSKEDQRRKQKELDAEVKRVVKEIIRKGMTEQEKELAINNYLCETAEYDMAALENAEKNDFKSTDDEFGDSFTPYGVLINKAGVCASYAAAFKLLADEAGLDCIVVTGNLFGSLSHAWNRVRIDSEWMTVDATNNDNEELFNSIFNLPDSVARTVLVEDNRYVASNRLYTGESEKWEYYRVNGLYYPKDEIVDILVKELKSSGAVTLRTSYDLTDKQFYDIVTGVVKKGRINARDIDGTYWLGTIYLCLP